MNDPWSTPEGLEELFRRAARGEQIPSAEASKPEAVAEAEASSALDGIRSLRERGWDFATPPPPKQWTLLRRAKSSTDQPGVFRRGAIGMLAGPAGKGKSTITLGMAASIATGCEFIGWRPPEPGKVLFVSTEDPDHIVHERLYALWPSIARLPGVTLDSMLDNFHSWSPRGANLHLLGSEREGFEPTPFAEQLRTKIDGGNYAMVIFDPLSRIAGHDTETSNSAGTLLIELLETMTDNFRTSILINHHTRKGSPGQDPRSMDAARGSSSLTGGVKWQANMESIEDKETGERWGIRLSNSKPNYNVPWPDVVCKWGAGFLREATEEELREFEQEQAAQKKRKEEAAQGRRQRTKAEAAETSAHRDERGNEQYKPGKESWR